MSRTTRTRRNPLRAVLDGLDAVLMAVSVALLAVIAVTVTWQVIARYITNSATAWAGELGTLAFVWLALLAIALGVRRGRHMVLDVWEYVPTRRWLTRLVETVAALVVCAVLAALAWFGAQGLETSFRRSMPGLGISFGWNALAVPVGSAIALVFAVEAWWDRVRTAEPAHSTSSEVARGETPSDAAAGADAAPVTTKEH